MAMIPMKRLQAVVLESQRDVFLKKLMLLGCVELTVFGQTEVAQWGVDRLRADEGQVVEITGQLERLKSALASLAKHAKPVKSKLFPDLKLLSLEQVEDSGLLEKALDSAQAISGLQKEIVHLHSQEEQLIAKSQSLAPWRTLSLPLEVSATENVAIYMGVCPFNVDIADFEARLTKADVEGFMTIVHADKAQHYLWLMVHKRSKSLLESMLSGIGFSPVSFKGMTGTAADNYDDLMLAVQGVRDQIKGIQGGFEGFLVNKEPIELCIDGLNLRRTREELRTRILCTSRTLYVAGWLPSERVPQAAKVFSALDCAYEFTEPAPGEEPPVAFKNTKVVAPFGIISALYGTPKYGSVVDPTPFMAPFFFVFFGMMMSDAAYGIIMTLLAIWVLRQQKKKNFIRQLFTLVFYCGLSTILWGAMFGSWFGDLIPVVTKVFTGRAYAIPPIWFDPLKKPMDMLVFSFSLGALQVLVGLGLSGWRSIKQGRWLDAVFDVGFWYLILFGLVMGLLKIPYGLEMAAFGAVAVILTAGRREKNRLKGLINGLLSLYGVTGYLADVLSYSRLLALGLASGVIASVVNQISVIGGKSIVGVISLILIFTIGHLFNLAINLVGAYVHASRLQYVEFFSKFFESGGIPFKPVMALTRYVTVKDDKEA